MDICTAAAVVVANTLMTCWTQPTCVESAGRMMCAAPQPIACNITPQAARYDCVRPDGSHYEWPTPSN
jgi:hypothetical protein